MSDLHIEFHAMQLLNPCGYDVASLAGDIHTQVSRHTCEIRLLRSQADATKRPMSMGGTDLVPVGLIAGAGQRGWAIANG